MYEFTETTTLVVKTAEQAKRIQKVYADLHLLLDAESSSFKSEIGPVVTQTKRAKWGGRSSIDGNNEFKWIVAPNISEAHRWIRDNNYKGRYKIVTSLNDLRGERMTLNEVVLVDAPDLDEYLIESIYQRIKASELAKYPNV